MRRGQLFESERQRRVGGRSLERLNPEVCPECLSPLAPETLGEPALFRHGGYGAMRETTTLHCHACGWSMVTEVSEVRP